MLRDCSCALERKYESAYTLKIVNVMWYIGKFDEATWLLFSEIGLTHRYLKSKGRGMAAVEQNVSYFRELMEGASVYVSSTIDEVKSKAIVFTHEMFNHDSAKLVARTRIVGVHIDTTKRKSVELESAILMSAISLSTNGMRT